MARSGERAAQLMKVSHSSVEAADKVRKQGVPELVDALAAGKVSVSAAARIAKLPAEQQQAVLAGIESSLTSRLLQAASRLQAVPQRGNNKPR